MRKFKNLHLTINAEAPAKAKKKVDPTDNSVEVGVDLSGVRRELEALKPEAALVTNEEDESTGTYAELTFNLDMVKVRHEILEGRNYTVCPMVMITEGVHNGSNGPLYYPPEELKKTPAVWNHKPIVVYHPTHNGQGISACEPAVISRRKVGLIMNTRYMAGKGPLPGKLVAEAWLETQRLPQVDERVAAAVKNRAQMEVSTGLFTDNEQKDGLWKKEPYTAIARNYRPDHLAILPDEKGSCSLADGAGLMRNSKGFAPGVKVRVKKGMAGGGKAGKITESTESGYHHVSSGGKHLGIYHESDLEHANKPGGGVRNAVRNAEISHSEIRDRLHNHLRTHATFPSGLKSGTPQDVPWLQEVYKTFCIYSVGSDMYKHDYEVDKTGEVKLKGLPEKVTSKRVYQNALGKTLNNSSGVKTMERDQIIDNLIENSEVFTEEDRETLNGFSDETLEAVANKVGCADTVTGDEGPNEDKIKNPKKFVKPKKMGSKSGVETKNSDDSDEDEEDDQKVKKNSAAITSEEYIANAPPEIREMLQASVQTHNAEKARLVEAICNNSAGVKMNKALLATRSLDDLQTMAALAAGPKQTRQVPRQQESLLMNNYSGAAGTGGYTANAEAFEGASDEPPLVCPTLNFSRNLKD